MTDAVQIVLLVMTVWAAVIPISFLIMLYNDLRLWRGEKLPKGRVSDILVLSLWWPLYGVVGLLLLRHAAYRSYRKLLRKHRA